MTRRVLGSQARQPRRPDSGFLTDPLELNCAVCTILRTIIQQVMATPPPPPPPPFLVLLCAIILVLSTICLNVAVRGVTVTGSHDTYVPSDDASWAIYSTHLSTLLGNDKQYLYDEHIEQCDAAARKEQSEGHRDKHDLLCSGNEENRLKMNREQPPSVYNYTTVGYQKLKTPPVLFDAIHHFYDINKDKAAEEWPTVNSYQNVWQIPSTIVRIEDGELEGGGRKLQDLIWGEAKEILQQWVGQELKPVALYGIRQYHRGSILAPHVDRMPLIISAIVNVDQKGIDEPWVLEVYGHDGKAANITMAVGDMILYESHSIIHGRPFPLRGDLYANIFLHFEPLDSNELNQYDPDLEIPPYLIPGSAWEDIWWAANPHGWHGEDEEVTSAGARGAIFRGDVDMLERIAKSSPDSLHEADQNGWHLLHEGVRTGDINIVQLLIENGADVNQVTLHGDTPLKIALQHHGEDHEMVDFLLGMGALEMGPDF